MKKFIICVSVLFIIFSINVSALECEFAVNPEFDSILQKKNGLSIVSKGDKTELLT